MKPDDVSMQICAPCKNVLNEIYASLSFLGLAATLTSLTVGSNTLWPCLTSSTTRWGLSLANQTKDAWGWFCWIFFLRQSPAWECGRPGWKEPSRLQRTSAPHRWNIIKAISNFPNLDLVIFSGTLARSEWDWRRLHGKPHLWGDLGKVTYKYRISDEAALLSS